MSKRDEAYELFEQGKRPGDPEVDALGLKRKTEKEYLGAWRNLKEGEETVKENEVVEEVTPPEELEREEEEPVEVASPFVSISSLQPRQLFMFRGLKYRLRCFEDSQAHVLLVELHPSGQYEVEQCGKYLDKNTMIKPI